MKRTNRDSSQHVDPRLWHAAKVASRALTNASIPHVLIGGLALSAYGYARTTRDVDFLVGNEAFIKHGAIVTLHPDVPLSVNKIPIDAIPMIEANEDDFFEYGKMVKGVPVADIVVIVYLKLRTGRRRDQQDVTELIARGLDVNMVRGYLRSIVGTEDLQHLLERLVLESSDES